MVVCMGISKLPAACETHPHVGPNCCWLHFAGPHVAHGALQPTRQGSAEAQRATAPPRNRRGARINLAVPGVTASRRQHVTTVTGPLDCLTRLFRLCACAVASGSACPSDSAAPRMPAVKGSGEYRVAHAPTCAAHTGSTRATTACAMGRTCTRSTRRRARSWRTLASYGTLPGPDLRYGSQ